MNDDEYLKLYEDGVKKQGIFHRKKGKIAFSNGLKLSDNPYTETNSGFALLWETGWKEAFEETKRNMNKRQRAIIIGGIVVIIIMFLFPPYASYRGLGVKLHKGYDVNYLLAELSQNKKIPENLAIDVETLSIQYVTVIIIGSLLWVLARDTKLKNNLKGDQGKTK